MIVFSNQLSTAGQLQLNLTKSRALWRENLWRVWWIIVVLGLCLSWPLALLGKLPLVWGWEGLQKIYTVSPVWSILIAALGCGLLFFQRLKVWIPLGVMGGIILVAWLWQVPDNMEYVPAWLDVLAFWIIVLTASVGLHGREGRKAIRWFPTLLAYLWGWGTLVSLFEFAWGQPLLGMLGNPNWNAAWLLAL
ncbi:MAG: hypothetical protein D6820_06720, partial [Lentisphaerae bacterium]